MNNVSHVRKTTLMWKIHMNYESGWMKLGFLRLICFSLLSQWRLRSLQKGQKVAIKGYLLANRETEMVLERSLNKHVMGIHCFAYLGVFKPENESIETPEIMTRQPCI